MKFFGANDAAAEIGCDPRALRRFLRQDPSYRNAGMGGRYMFDPAELVSLGKAFRASTRLKQARRRRDDDPRILDDDPGVELERLERATVDKGERMRLRQERQQPRLTRQRRLLDRMAAVLPERYDDEVPDE